MSTFIFENLTSVSLHVLINQKALPFKAETISCASDSRITCMHFLAFAISRPFSIANNSALVASPFQSPPVKPHNHFASLSCPTPPIPVSLFQGVKLPSTFNLTQPKSRAVHLWP
ncbi:hypothetical protein RJT34_25596 [Clitoria ternatea]|uniref:Uncharacterized protein n=1 Tax=Clitoria ternatea TaxID=43366 RepID=A0AAN9FQ89_CLITE